MSEGVLDEDGLVYEMLIRLAQILLRAEECAIIS